MRSTMIGVLTTACVLGAVIVSGAAAGGYTSQAYKGWHSNTSTDWQGTRVTVDNPASGERYILHGGEFFNTSALAGDGIGNNLIQQSVTYEYADAEGPSCNLGVGLPQMYYYVEIIQGGNPSCYSESGAGTTESHVQKVERGTAGNWRSYLDGTYQGHQTTWTPCSGNACDLDAFSEFDNLAGSEDSIAVWHGKFAGSGNTEGQQYNGCCWSTINNATNFITPSSLWSGPSGPFPQGIWSFTH